jgi:hypothetical protein
MKIYYEIEIQGTKPMLINTFPIDTLSTKKPKSGSAGNDEESWKRTVLMDANRNLFIYNTYLVGAIVGGGKHIKVGKGTLSKKIGATLEVIENQILLIDRIVPKDEDILKRAEDSVYLDVRSVVNPMTKGRNLRYRIAAKEGWKCHATISWDDRAASREEMKSCVEYAGLFEGVGDGRRIGFGRFKLLSFAYSDMNDDQLSDVEVKIEGPSKRKKAVNLFG